MRPQLLVKLPFTIQTHGSQSATIPESQRRKLAAAAESPFQTKMFRARRIGQQDQSRHPRLDDDRFVRGQIQNDAFAQPADGCHRFPPNSPRQRRKRGANQNRFAGAAAAANGFNLPRDDVRPNAADHRFDFRQFRHGPNLPQKDDKWESSRRAVGVSPRVLPSTSDSSDDVFRFLHSKNQPADARIIAKTPAARQQDEYAILLSSRFLCVFFPNGC